MCVSHLLSFGTINQNESVYALLSIFTGIREAISTFSALANMFSVLLACSNVELRRPWNKIKFDNKLWREEKAYILTRLSSSLFGVKKKVFNTNGLNSNCLQRWHVEETSNIFEGSVEVLQNKYKFFCKISHGKIVLIFVSTNVDEEDIIRCQITVTNTQ